MSRVTAPITKLTRVVNPGVASPYHNHGAILMPKYAELLKKSPADADVQSARGITTTHRPTPQPKPSKSYNRPLMQTFSSVSTSSHGAAPPTIDATIFPFPTAAFAAEGVSSSRMPLLPDSFLTRHPVAEASEAAVVEPRISVVASASGSLSPASALTEIEGMGIDGVELRFAHASETPQREPAIIVGL
ncbi:hypothetical protein SODALDRAFT_67817 [Sodiomyces alkalinus F11]|uniref:Uncharacterized protein n=1 Tax=Sodiomyces alkalinus (strain CBS 110278 / VKM F-3762 / F11) TaxID=1314773 RepID=A0A3N2PLS3_SODAK|nr:hypothetical protein SODALDRAFT_67817 [Sodiomyces alkalinus F11]ROT35485.1 hypothetical protein SODALDRAFT_67817 [Sodiomyces alkalinus F11]